MVKERNITSLHGSFGFVVCIHFLLVHPETMSPALHFENCSQKIWAPCSQGTSCRRCRRHQPHKYSLKVRLVEVVCSLVVVNWPEKMNHAECDMQIFAITYSMKIRGFRDVSGFLQKGLCPYLAPTSC